MSGNILSTTPCEILGITKETEHEFTFRLACEKTPKHGQFFQLSVPKFGEAPISVSGFGDGYVDFTIRSVGKVTEEIFRLDVGDTIGLRGPYGVGWPVDKLKKKHVIIVAGGTGVAPVKTLIEMIYNDKNYVKSLDLVIGFRDSSGILFRDDLEKWKNAFNTIYTLDNDDENVEYWESGLVTKHLSKISLKDYGEDYEIIIVGPPIMMHFVAVEFLKLGAEDKKMWVSFERKMSCAVGKCGHCRIDEVYVCLEGPVFNYNKARKLID